MTFLVRNATDDDVTQIARVHLDAWRHAYKGFLPDSYLASLPIEMREAFWQMIMSLDKTCTLVAELNNHLIGFVNGGISRDQGSPFDSEIYGIFVLPSAHGQGIGKALAEAFAGLMAAQGAKGVHAWVMASNPARGFYERMRAVPMGERIQDTGCEQLREINYAWLDIQRLLAQ